MITRFEVDGFKNLKEFSCDFAPYTCIAGPNSVGKSNVFDALAFLAATASVSFNQAASSMRGQSGDIDDLFAPDHSEIHFAVELIVQNFFTDEFQRSVSVDHTYLRYELRLAKEQVPVAAGGTVSTLKLVEETLAPLPKKRAEARLGWVRWGTEFAKSALKFSGHTKSFISTSDGTVKISSQVGRPPEIPLANQPVGSSALSGFGMHEFPFVAVVRAELRNWLTLSLEPSAMRAPSEATAPDHVNQEGGNLPKTLSRLSAAGTDTGVLEDLVDSVRELVDVREIVLDFDQARQLFTLRARVAGAPMLPARSLSDGTLRFIALSILQLDPEFSGVVCFEEPENGIHPRKMREMFQLIQDLAVDTGHAISDENPLRQVLVNTHSPSYIYQHGESLGNLLMASTKPQSNALMLSPVRMDGTWRPAANGQVPPQVVLELLEESFPGVDFSSWEAL